MGADILKFPDDYERSGEVWIPKKKEVNDMAKENEQLTVISDPMRSLTERLAQTRSVLKLMKEQEAGITDGLKELLVDWDIKKVTDFLIQPEGEEDGANVVLTVRPGSSSSLNKDMLIDNGVLPSVIKKSMKESKFVKYEPKCGF